MDMGSTFNLLKKAMQRVLLDKKDICNALTCNLLDNNINCRLLVSSHIINVMIHSFLSTSANFVAMSERKLNVLILFMF